MKTWLSLMLLAIAVAKARGAVLQGRITDATGATVQNAYVFAFDDQAKVSLETTSFGKSTLTARDGTFQMKLAPGFYDVCVFSSGFTTACKKVFVSKPDKVLTVTWRLAVDPLVLKLRGDSFFGTHTPPQK